MKETNQNGQQKKSSALHFCILSGDVYPLPDANGVCVMELAKALVKKGHKVDIICNGRKNQFRAHREDGITFHIVKSNYTAPYQYTILERLLRVIFLRIELPIYPIKDYFRIRRYVSMARRINARKKIDCLVASVLPVETICAGIKLKESGDIRKCIIYQLDSVGNNRFDLGKGIMQKYRRANARKAEKVYFEKADHIFELKCNEFFYSRRAFQNVQHKIGYLDIPLVSDQIYTDLRALEQTVDRDASKVTFIYGGVLHKEFRDPTPLLQLINQLNREKAFQCECSFYTKRADLYQYCGGITEKELTCFHNNGYVSQEELNQHYAESDFLLSVGNHSTSEIHEIPSKIFPYISTGKPIIHLTGGKYDACIPYLSRYSNALLIDPGDKFEDNYQKLKAFISRNKGKIMDIEKIMQDFETNTAAYSAELLTKAALQHEKQITDKKCR